MMTLLLLFMPILRGMISEDIQSFEDAEVIDKKEVFDAEFDEAQGRLKLMLQVLDKEFLSPSLVALLKDDKSWFQLFLKSLIKSELYMLKNDFIPFVNKMQLFLQALKTADRETIRHFFTWIGGLPAWRVSNTDSVKVKDLGFKIDDYLDNKPKWFVLNPVSKLAKMFVT